MTSRPPAAQPGAEPRPVDLAKRNSAVCLSQTKGILAEFFGMSLQEADELLQAWSRRCGRPPEVVATVFLHQIWHGHQACSDQDVARLLEDALRHLPEAPPTDPDVAGQ